MASGILLNIRKSFQKQNRLALLLGAGIAGALPVITYVLIHSELDWASPFMQQPKAWLALGGLSFSSLSLFAWARVVFKHDVEWLGVVKALGFTVLLEGSAALSSSKAVSLGALLLVVFVNAINAAMNLVSDHKAALAEEREELGGDTMGLARRMAEQVPAPVVAPLQVESAASPTVHRARSPRRPRKAPVAAPEPVNAELPLTAAIVAA